MDLRDDIEFVADDGLAIWSDDDVVDVEPRQLPRWAIALTGLAVVAIVLGLATQAREHSAPIASPGPTGSLDSQPLPAGLGAPIPLAAVRLGPAASAPVYLLQPGELYKFTDSSTVRVRLGGPDFARFGRSVELVADAAANRVWAVVLDLPGGEIIEFDSRSLHRLRTIHSVDAVRDAAALNGHLYLATTGLADVAPGATVPRPVPGWAGYIAALAADPKRARVLLLVLGAGTSIRQVSAAGQLRDGRAGQPVGGGSLRVTGDGAIWLAGFGGANDGAVLVRLDPGTLLPLGGSPVVAELGATSWIEAAGDRDIWVRSAGDSEGLWCVDGRDGAVLQHWPRAPGAMVSRKGTAYLVTNGALVPLVMGRCRG